VKTNILMKIMCLFAALSYSVLADAQSFPRLKPIPPRGPRAAVAPALALSAKPSTASPWQALKNQPPFTSNDCNGGFPGAANPLLLTDGTVIVQDAGCPDWWRLTPDHTGSYANGTWTQIASLPPGYAPLYTTSLTVSSLPLSGPRKAPSTIRLRTSGRPLRRRRSSISFRICRPLPR
jgi:hypothetical protein